MEHEATSHDYQVRNVWEGLACTAFYTCSRGDLEEISVTCNMEVAVSDGIITVTATSNYDGATGTDRKTITATKENNKVIVDRTDFNHMSMLIAVAGYDTTNQMKSCCMLAPDGSANYIGDKVQVFFLGERNKPILPKIILEN